MVIRMARSDDAALIAYHRTQMFREMGVLPDHLVGALQTATQELLPSLIDTGTYVGWLAEEERSHNVVAGVGLYLRAILPRPGAIRPGVPGVIDREGIVLNAYTQPTHRRKGTACALMQAMLEWSRSAGVTRLVLHASPQGKPLYEQLGFQPGNEMRYAGDETPDNAERARS
jgi:GNAT superfamily N-acetyltransferase